MSSKKYFRTNWQGGQFFCRLLQSLTLAACLTAASAVAQAQTPQHLQDALTLATQIRLKGEAGIFMDASNVPLNRHGGDWSAPNQSYVRFENVGAGVLPGNYTECAPFVTRILQHTYGWSWSSYYWTDPANGQVSHSASPNSYKYVGYIKSLLGFSQRIMKLDQVQPGDIVSMRDIGQTTGHTGIVVSVNLDSAKVYPSNWTGALARWAGTTYYELNVVDSSADCHTQDSKQFFDQNGLLITQTQGVGTGIMGVLVDANMEVVAHTWSLPTGDYDGNQQMRTQWLNSLHGKLRDQFAAGGREMVFGRLNLP